MPARIRLKSSTRGLGKIGVKSAPRKKANRPKKIHPDREGQFLKLWAKLAGAAKTPVPQYVLHDERQWRFDFARPDSLVAVEIAGGVFQRKATGHRSVSGVIRDAEKSNAAQLNGWCLLRFNSKDLDKKPSQVVACILKALDNAAQIFGEE